MKSAKEAIEAQEERDAILDADDEQAIEDLREVSGESETSPETEALFLSNAQIRYAYSQMSSIVENAVATDIKYQEIQREYFEQFIDLMFSVGQTNPQIIKAFWDEHKRSSHERVKETNNKRFLAIQDSVNSH